VTDELTSLLRGRHGSNGMVVRFTSMHSVSITTEVVIRFPPIM
jgi:hypothetical protein